MTYFAVNFFYCRKFYKKKVVSRETVNVFGQYKRTMVVGLIENSVW